MTVYTSNADMSAGTNGSYYHLVSNCQLDNPMTSTSNDTRSYFGRLDVIDYAGFHA